MRTTFRTVVEIICRSTTVRVFAATGFVAKKSCLQAFPATWISPRFGSIRSYSTVENIQGANGKAVCYDREPRTRAYKKARYLHRGASNKFNKFTGDFRLPRSIVNKGKSLAQFFGIVTGVIHRVHSSGKL